jgi:hypothetical protein
MPFKSTDTAMNLLSTEIPAVEKRIAGESDRAFPPDPAGEPTPSASFFRQVF